jgi:hypothetical protein
MTPLQFIARRALLVAALASALGGCHELGNPVTRVTPVTPFPATPPHTTMTHLTYAHSSEAVAWRRPPAHALDQNLPRARYIARIDVDHGQVSNAGARVRLATTVAFVDGRTRTVQWVAPTAASPWSLDLALASPPAGALTRVVGR